MKFLPAPLLAHYAPGYASTAYALLVARADGTLLGFTSADVPFDMDLTPWGLADDSFTFTESQGLLVSNIVATAGLEVDNLELTTLDDGTVFTHDDVRAGRWRGTRFWLFKYRLDVATPAIGTDVDVRMAGTLGEVTLGDATVTVELRGLAQRLQQPVGIVSSKTCRSRLGATGLGQCNKDLTAFTHALTVTAVASSQQFTASAAIQAADYFGEGLVTFNTGALAGTTHKVRDFATGGVFTLTLPAALAINVGDTFTAVAGCRKRLTEDCKTKFSNVVNFQGEPHRPTTDDLTTT